MWLRKRIASWRMIRAHAKNDRLDVDHYYLQRAEKAKSSRVVRNRGDRRFRNLSSNRNNSFQQCWAVAFKIAQGTPADRAQIRPNPVCSDAHVQTQKSACVGFGKALFPVVDELDFWSQIQNESSGFASATPSVSRTGRPQVSGTAL